MSSIQVKLKSNFDNKKNSHAIQQSQPMDTTAPERDYGYSNEKGAETK